MHGIGPSIQASKIGDILTGANYACQSRNIGVQRSQLPFFTRPQTSSGPEEVVETMQLVLHMPGETGDLSCIVDGFDSGDRMVSAASMAEIKKEAVVAKLSFQGLVVASAAVRLVRLAADQQIVVAFRPIVVNEHWQNIGLAKRLVQCTRSMISDMFEGAPIDILVKATSRSWRMFLAEDARLCRRLLPGRPPGVRDGGVDHSNAADSGLER